jgi:hypothetical protein
MWIKGANLSRKEFTELHTALCYLYNYSDQLKRLNGASPIEVEIEKAFSVLKPSFDEAKQLSDAISDYWSGVKSMNAFRTIWSIEDISVNEAGDVLVPDCNAEHGYPEDATLVYEGIEVQGMGKTWLDLYRICNQLAMDSEDYHHVFIEGFSKSKTKPNTYHLIMGS